MSIHRLAIGLFRSLLLLSFTAVASLGQSSSDCAVLPKRLQGLFGKDRLTLAKNESPIQSGVINCTIKVEDIYSPSRPPGILAITMFTKGGLALLPDISDRKPPNTQLCRGVLDAGQVADWCGIEPSRDVLTVYRNNVQVLRVDYTQGTRGLKDNLPELTAALIGPYTGPPNLSKPILKKHSPRFAKLDALMSSLESKASQGDTVSAFDLASLYQYSPTGSPDYLAAAYWYKQAADHDSTGAAYRLGLLYLDALGVEKDESQAYKLFEKAATAGYVSAMTKLAELIWTRDLFGNGSYYSAEWFDKAVAANDPDALDDMGIREWNNSKSHSHESDRSPLEWFQAAAAKGQCDALLNIGGLYYNGDTVKQDATEAAKWFAKARNCPGASEEEKQRAIHFGGRAAQGKVPQKTIQSSLEERHDTQLLDAITKLLNLYKMLPSSSSGSSSKTDFQENQERGDKINKCVVDKLAMQQGVGENVVQSNGFGQPVSCAGQ